MIRMKLRSAIHIALCSVALSNNITSASELTPFTTDGCSMFPNGDSANKVKWMRCCTQHDYAYWKGGTEDDRFRADEALKQCVADLGESEISMLMHLGVRLGGEPYFPTWYRWGYGWPYLRGYQSLSEKENEQVMQRMIELQQLINEFIESEN
ncbi:hypothetical protein GCM10025791_31580 [Halioxenophilus aromaticivorans]|uniref:FAD-binding oxidoreductase n=2 Tax=Halioxenophilus aromaticivorans TaxID=1306992 RepID=A0AAV3U5F0_9ALTE